MQTHTDKQPQWS